MFIATQLIGFGASSDVAAAATITQVLSANSSGSATITFPGGIQAGDLIVLLDFAAGTSGVPLSVTPSGFTIIEQNTGGAVGPECRIILSRKLATGSESGSLTGMAVQDVSNHKVMVVFRKSPAASSITSGSPSSQVQDVNPSGLSIAASGGVAPLVVIGSYAVAAGATVNPRTFTVGGSAAKDGEVASGTSAYVAWKIYNASPADVSVDMDDEGNCNSLAGCYIQM